MSRVSLVSGKTTWEQLCIAIGIAISLVNVLGNAFGNVVVNTAQQSRHPTVSVIVNNDHVWPTSKSASLYAAFDSTLVHGQIGKTGVTTGLSGNVCLGYLNDMMVEYEFAGDLIPVIPIMVGQEARAQFWPRFIRLEGFKTISTDGMSVDARLQLLRRYGYLVNRGFDAAEQVPRTGSN